VNGCTYDYKFAVFDGLDWEFIITELVAAFDQEGLTVLAGVNLAVCAGGPFLYGRSRCACVPATRRV
jgi:hypothetical protein